MPDEAADFRRRQHAEPHPGLRGAQGHSQLHQARQGRKLGWHGGKGAEVAEDLLPPERCLALGEDGRVVVHVDIDCFYAQAEEVRDPSLRSKPLGVTQKYLVVTANYPARRGYGITKLMGIQEARRRCPALVLVSGEDLTPYRRASKQIAAVLRRFAPVQRLGLDESWLDVTALVAARLGRGTDTEFCGHVYDPGGAMRAASRHRPQDLRMVPGGGPGEGPGRRKGGEAGSSGTGPRRFAAGSAVAEEIRRALRRETGFTASVGVSCNKALAKLCGGLHKPDAQTILLPRDAAGFLAPLPVRVLPGVGHKLEAAMKALKIHTIRDLRARSAAELAAGLGVPRARAERLLALGWGWDDEAVVLTGPPKSVSVEDSFKSCNSWGAVERVLRVLYPDLLVRVAEAYDEHGILPQRLALKWRFRRTSEGARAKGNARVSTSTDCPRCLPEATRAGGAADRDRTVAELVAVALGALRRELRPPFDLSLINVAATSFAPAPQQPLAFAAAARGAPGGRRRGRTTAAPPTPGGTTRPPRAGSATDRSSASSRSGGPRRGGGRRRGRRRPRTPTTSTTGTTIPAARARTPLSRRRSRRRNAPRRSGRGRRLWPRSTAASSASCRRRSSGRSGASSRRGRGAGAEGRPRGRRRKRREEEGAGGRGRRGASPRTSATTTRPRRSRGGGRVRVAKG